MPGLRTIPAHLIIWSINSDIRFSRSPPLDKPPQTYNSYTPAVTAGPGNPRTHTKHSFPQIPEPESYLPEEDDVAFLDDLAWVLDTALRMGLDAQVIWNEELLREQGSQAENSFHTRFFSRDYSRIPKFGTFNLQYVTTQLSDQSVFRIIVILQNLSLIKLSDAAWAQIIRASCDKKKREHLDIPGFWWLLVLGKRDPSKIIEIFTKVRPSLEYVPDEKDERIVREVAGELNDGGVGEPESGGAESDEIPAILQLEIVPGHVSRVDIPKQIVVAEEVPAQSAEIPDTVQSPTCITPVKQESVISHFRIGTMLVTEVEFDHNIDDLLEESVTTKNKKKDPSLSILDDLFETEKLIKKT